MIRDATGTYYSTATAGETVRAFVPSPLPPSPSRLKKMEDML